MAEGSPASKPSNGHQPPAEIDVPSEVARLALQGHSPGQIAGLVGTPVSGIIQLLTSSQFTKVLDKVRREERAPTPEAVFSAGVPIAQQTMAELMLTGTEKTRAKMSLAWVDRAGYAPKQRSEVNFRGVLAHAHMTEDNLREILTARIQRMRESAPSEQPGES
jgi:hypothetical protein